MSYDIKGLQNKLWQNGKIYIRSSYVAARLKKKGQIESLWQKPLQKLSASRPAATQNLIDLFVVCALLLLLLLVPVKCDNLKSHLMHSSFMMLAALSSPQLWELMLLLLLYHFNLHKLDKNPSERRRRTENEKLCSINGANVFLLWAAYKM